MSRVACETLLRSVSIDSFSIPRAASCEREIVLLSTDTVLQSI
jgi:hypothetical protein